MTLGDEQYVSVKPKDKVLRKYIAYYYFNSSFEKGYTKKFIFYPHYKNALTVYKNGKIELVQNCSYAKPCLSQKYEIGYTGILSEGQIVMIDAPFNKLGVVFQPLGINNFFSEPLSEIVLETPILNFNYFGDEFINLLDMVFDTDHIEQKVDYLDYFFCSELQPLNEQRIIKAVSLLLEKDMPIQNVSGELGINRKTLQRLFRRHLNCTPKAFATIVKFRRALNLYQSKEQKPQLTQFTYENEYYDQSDFIKHFKKVTGFNPKKFFADISHLGSEDTFWTLLEN
ncbi:helix-turn-helix domain-containing protein [Winogradskyella sp.]|uniref:helix-turn-helix domain-containing protein n=1 Tax=Winogradskyella sp. TaxID=1883156 RepID=UPI003BA9B84F